MGRKAGQQQPARFSHEGEMGKCPYQWVTGVTTPTGVSITCVFFLSRCFTDCTMGFVTFSIRIKEANSKSKEGVRTMVGI